MSFTEFYCDASSGSNMNGGSPIGGSYPFTYASSTWTSTTGVFVVSSGNPQSDGVTVGDYASVFLTGATVPVYYARVTARNTTSITVAFTGTGFVGTPPVTGTTGYTIIVGGPWKGPNGTDTTPLSLIGGNLYDGTNTIRCNMKNNSTYSISSAITMSTAGPARIQGYSSTVGDGGRFLLDCAANAIAPLTLGAAQLELYDAILSTSASSGTTSGLTLNTSATFNIVRGVAAHGFRGAGILISVQRGRIIECETYNCNTANTVNVGGITLSGSDIVALRCYSHDNTSGVNAHGFQLSTSDYTCIECIADSNTGSGFDIAAAAGTGIALHCCDSYNNTKDGLTILTTSPSSFVVENCNFFKNGGWGINGSGSGSRVGYVVNCMFGSGTQANSSGTTTGLKSMVEQYWASGVWNAGSLSYTSNQTPWNAPTTGDFSIIGAACKGTGRGSFTETDGTNTGTLAYPDIGAGQGNSTQSGGSGGVSRNRVQRGM